jgi:hypothetical protein
MTKATTKLKRLKLTKFIRNKANDLRRTRMIMIKITITTITPNLVLVIQFS